MNRDTGEVLYALVPVAKARCRGGRFFMAMMEAFRYLAEHPLPMQPQRVLNYLFSVLDFENWLHVEQRKIAEDLGMKPANVSAAVKILEQRGIISRGPKSGRLATYRLNPNVGWRGTAEGHAKALTEAHKRWGMDNTQHKGGG